tara:strand:+ start:3245 stop:4171 length:927 start_codon:yes stop_codon:yes gene_type:complete
MEQAESTSQNLQSSKLQSKTNFSPDESLRVSVLSEALPYIQRFAGKRLVIKYGGAAMANSGLQEAVLRDIALLSSVGVQPIIVHGGGPEINYWLNQLDITTEFRDGLRVTDNKTMEVVEMVLVGRVNKQIVNGINKLGALSIGLCGIDGKLIEARQYNKGSHGLVGEITRVNIDILEPLLAKGYVPVISSVAFSNEGISLNVNADTIAGELAASLQAEKLILLTDTPGILKDKDDPSSLITQIELSDIQKLLKEGVIEGGMMPKTQCCIRALTQGVSAAHIINGKTPHALLLEVFTNVGIGTMVLGNS